MLIFIVSPAYMAYVELIELKHSCHLSTPLQCTVPTHLILEVGRSLCLALERFQDATISSCDRTISSTPVDADRKILYLCLQHPLSFLLESFPFHLDFPYSQTLKPFVCGEGVKCRLLQSHKTESAGSKNRVHYVSRPGQV